MLDLRFFNNTMFLNKLLKTKYEGQALAIAMVVLVVSSLIGISIYSRTMKDKMLTLEERASAEAFEVSDVILDKLTIFPINTVIEEIKSLRNLETFSSDGVVLLENNNGLSEITGLLRNLGALDPDSGDTISSIVDPMCPITLADNEYRLTLQEADENTYYEIRPGNVWSLPFADLIKEDGCELNLRFAIRGDSGAGFVMTKVYCRYDVDGNVIDCKDYEDSDIVNYCFSDDGENCNNRNFLDSDNWEKYGTESSGATNIVLVPASEEYSLGEVRIKAVGGTIGISYDLSDICADGLRMYLLRATATCSGVYRGKEILVPEKKWYNPLFDYVLFNGQGSI